MAVLILVKVAHADGRGDDVGSRSMRGFDGHYRIGELVKVSADVAPFVGDRFRRSPAGGVTAGPTGAACAI